MNLSVCSQSVVKVTSFMIWLHLIFAISNEYGDGFCAAYFVDRRCFLLPLSIDLPDRLTIKFSFSFYEISTDERCSKVVCLFITIVEVD
jgi:hypothetical protein